MENFLNINPNINKFKNDFLNDFSDVLEKKYSQNKKELLSFIDSSCIKPRNDKEFFREIFKLMDNYLNQAEQETLDTLSVYMDIPILSKVILFLKYKKVDSYKDKIKMIKTITKDMTLEELLFHEQIILNELNFISEYASEECTGFIMDIDASIDKYKFRRHLLLFKNVVLIIKCALFNFHKKDIMYFENGTPKYKIVPVKYIYIFELEFKLGSKIDIDKLLNALKEYEKVTKEVILKIPKEIASLLIYAHLKEDIVNDDFNKCLLDKSYIEKVNNRMDSFIETNSFMIFSDILKRRKVLIPKNGIVILVENEESPIESILLSEKELIGINNLYFITRYKDGTEIVNSITLSNDFSYNAPIRISDKETNCMHLGTISYVLDFLGIEKYVENESTLKYSVISPVYWKYRNRGYKSENDKLNDKGIIIKREFEIEIAPFLRKINGQPGNEALQLAKKLGLILEDGYTIVKPHTRTYSSQKIII